MDSNNTQNSTPSNGDTPPQHPTGLEQESTTPVAPARESLNTPQPPKNRSKLLFVTVGLIGLLVIAGGISYAMQSRRSSPQAAKVVTSQVKSSLPTDKLDQQMTIEITTDSTAASSQTTDESSNITTDNSAAGDMSGAYDENAF